MDTSHSLFFGPYRLDRRSRTLWRGEQPISLRPRTFSLLQYLAERPGDIVSAQELQQHVWEGVNVAITGLRVCVHELRQALEDDANPPHYIETLRGQGYRFCSRVTTPGGTPLAPDPEVIGRTHELSQLRTQLALARQGQRQLAFVSGEAGMGKTTLVEAFLAALAESSDTQIAWGYCLEHSGSVEAYLPVLEALGSLGRSPFGDQLVRILRQAAPTWLMQLPMLLPATECANLHLDVQASTRLRMIRELIDALGLLSTDRLVILVLEDLHWSDSSTIELLGAVMQRRDPAQLLILGTYRPLEVQVRAHPLVGLLQERQAQGQGLDVRLTPWITDAINAFLGHRLPGAIDAGLAAMLYERSGGNPLFLSRLVDYLMQKELLIDSNGQWRLRDEGVADRALPDGVRQLLIKQMDQLPDRVQAALQAASVAGIQFTTAIVAAGTEAENGLIDEALTWAASRSYFLQAQALEAWPDGTISGAYRFGHALYRQVLYERLSAERRMKLHRLMAQRLECAYIDDLNPVVGLLAYHFAQGGEVSRALVYLYQASVKALRRFAANEAIAHLHTALELLPALPPERDRVDTEYHLQATLGTAIIASRGARVPEASTAYQRAYQLGKAIGDIDQFFPTVVGLEHMALGRADYGQSQHLGGRLLNYAQITQDPLHLAHAYCALSVNRAMQGHYVIAHDYADTCSRLPFPPDRFRDQATYTIDPIVMCQRWDVVVLIELGYPEQAAARSQACMARARELGDPFSMMQGLVSVMALGMYSLPPSALYESAQAVVTYAGQQGLLFWEAVGTIILVCAMARLGHATDGLAQLETALSRYRATRHRQSRSRILTLAAESYYYAGHVETSLALLQEVEAFIDDSGERIVETGLHELRGKLLQRQGHFSEAEACFVRALTLARQQRAKGTELRATTLLSRLWQEQGKQEQARHLLLPIYNGFTEGFDTAELQEAKTLLDALSG